MRAGEAWLRERVQGAPPRLFRRMVEALPERHAGSVPDALAAGALGLYAQVVGGSGGREDALPLLAADALFTHAFEAQAELDPGGLAGFAARWGGGGRLGEIAG